MKKLDYLLIGHFSRDIQQDGSYKIGGGVFHSGITAQKLGAKVKVLTSFSRDLKIEHFLKFEIKNIPSKLTTTFENIYLPEGRIQFLHQRAKKVLPKHLPANWRNPQIAHLAPIDWEIDEKLTSLFKNSLKGATLQGWLRKRDKQKRVHFNLWQNYKKYLPLFDVAILSREDIEDKFSLAKEFATRCPILVLTERKGGCKIFWQGKIRQFGVKKVMKENYPTGVGDVFAAAYLIKFYQTKNPYQSAEFANKTAAFHIKKHILNY